MSIFDDPAWSGFPKHRSWRERVASWCGFYLFVAGLCFLSWINALIRSYQHNRHRFVVPPLW